MGVGAEVRFKWCFGATATAEGGAVLGSSGNGARFYANGLSREQLFLIETDAGCTCSYQILGARTQAGASIVLSSGTLAAASLDMVHLTGPFPYFFPRIKTITSTSVNVTVELYGN